MQFLLFQEADNSTTIFAWMGALPPCVTMTLKVLGVSICSIRDTVRAALLEFTILLVLGSVFVHKGARD